MLKIITKQSKTNKQNKTCNQFRKKNKGKKKALKIFKQKKIYFLKKKNTEYISQGSLYRKINRLSIHTYGFICKRRDTCWFLAAQLA